MAREQISPEMRRLSTYVSGALKRKLPQKVVDRAKLHLLDTFAAIISGSRQLPGQRAIAFVKPLGGTPEAGVMGTRIVTTTINAALANGMFCHADETDDTHPPTRTHPGASVTPAALAIAEKRQLSGETLLRAVVLGYDICARTMMSLKPNLLVPTGRHAAATGQLFGAAAATGALLELTPQQVRYMLSYTLQQASGLTTMFRDPHHIEKAFAMAGIPAQHAVQAGLAASLGFTGVDDILSGEPNMFSILSPGAEREAISADLGKRYEILRGGIKRWTAGGPCQGPLHVLNEIIQMHGIKAKDVKKLVARMPMTEIWVVNDRAMPDISLQHLLAVMLVDGTLTFASSHDYGRMKDPRVVNARKFIHAVADETMPTAVRGWRCIMDVTLNDGRKISHQTMAATGSPDNPAAKPDVEAKALDLLAPVLGKKRAVELMTAIDNIQSIKNVRTLRRLYTA
jgi:2-methylcitrate dehydratase PrpD